MKYLAILFLLPLASEAQLRPVTAVVHIAPKADKLGEIISIDGNPAPDRPTSVIYMEGRRTVAYRCPGTNVPASMRLDLKGGLVYELLCHGAKAEVRVSPQTWP